MTEKLGALVVGLLTSFGWTANAFAFGGVVENPEIDGPGGVMAVALLVSVGIMIYRKAQK